AQAGTQPPAEAATQAQAGDAVARRDQHLASSVAGAAQPREPEHVVGQRQVSTPATLGVDVQALAGDHGGGDLVESAGVGAQASGVAATGGVAERLPLVAGRVAKLVEDPPQPGG